MPHDYLRSVQKKAAEPPLPRGPVFVEDAGPPARRVVRLPKASRRWVRGLLALIVIVIVVFAGAGGIAAASALAGRAALSKAQDALAASDTAGFQRQMTAAEGHFNRARMFAGPFLVFLPIPSLGTQVKAVDHLLTAATVSTGAVNDAFKILHDLLALESAAEGTIVEVPSAATLASLTPEEKRAMLAKLAAAAPKINDIDRRVRAALQEIDSIPSDGLAGPLAEQILPLKARVAQLRDALLPIAPLAEILPAMAGYPTPKTYMFLMLNNTELRPGGGFIGSFGIIATSNGEVTRFSSEDVYALDAPTFGRVGLPAPKPFADYINIKEWGMRDANWSPDFRRSSEQVIALYDRERALARPDLPAVDGIIAITPEVAADLLRMVGPVTVDGVTFTADNLLDELQYQVHQAFLTQGLPESQRKQILGKLVSQVFQKMFALPAERWPEGLAAVQKHLTEKRILLYEKDPVLQGAFEQHHWAGRMVAADGDYLRWVDANLGALKTDVVMERSLGYALRVAPDGQIIATASMRYKNNGTFTFRTTRYRTYARIYVPQGSKLIRVDGSLKNDRTKNPSLAPGVPDAGVEEGKTWFGAFTAIEPGDERTLTFTYALPANVSRQISDGSYSLVVQKQLGTQSFPLSLTIDLPRRVTSAEPGEEVAEFGDARYRLQTNLRVDRGFVVSTR
ncbi:DUF4012 domain-containing protein [Patescibacteria group bacterium]|nr:MAG: DUF4012 domain-containing protein [Patescibacteria group bacterium]